MKIYVDISDVDNALERLERYQGTLYPALESILATSFLETQMVVHIITHSLKSSARINSNFDKTSWSGEIVYGGPSPGSINEVVEYAYYEQRRGDVHDFMRPAVERDKDYGEAILRFMETEG